MTEVDYKKPSLRILDPLAEDSNKDPPTTKQHLANSLVSVSIVNPKRSEGDIDLSCTSKLDQF